MRGSGHSRIDTHSEGWGVWKVLGGCGASGGHGEGCAGDIAGRMLAYGSDRHSEFHVRMFRRHLHQEVWVGRSLPLFTATACPAGQCYLCEPHGHTQVRGAGWLCERPRFCLAGAPPPSVCRAAPAPTQEGAARRRATASRREGWVAACALRHRGATPGQDFDNALVFRRHQSTGRRCSRRGKMHVSQLVPH